MIRRQRMLPRPVLPRQFYLVTRRCAQRQFLLRPDAATNNAFLYCLIAAALRSEIDVLLPCAMSNHYNAVIYDRAGRYPEFIEHFHKLLARSQNALRGRWENLWSCEQTCVVNLVDRDAVIDKLVYTASNPVADQLVDRAHHWLASTAWPPCCPHDRCMRPARCTSSGPTATCLMPSSSRSPCPPSSDLPRPCARSYATAYAPSSSDARPSVRAPVAACSVVAPCSRSRGARVR